MITLTYKLLGEDREPIFTGAITIKKETPYTQIEEMIKEDLYTNEDPSFLEEQDIRNYREHYTYYTEELEYELLIVI